MATCAKNKPKGNTHGVDNGGSIPQCIDTGERGSLGPTAKNCIKASEKRR